MIQNHLLPLPEGLPTFQSAVKTLDRVPEILYRGLEYGASKTSEFRQREFPRKRLDACLSASIFRAHGIEYLRREGIDAQPDGFKWMFNNLPFLGISFYYNQCTCESSKAQTVFFPAADVPERSTDSTTNSLATICSAMSR